MDDFHGTYEDLKLSVQWTQTWPSDFSELYLKNKTPKLHSLCAVSKPATMHSERVNNVSADNPRFVPFD
jgi:hypothetical protein